MWERNMACTKLTPEARSTIHLQHARKCTAEEADQRIICVADIDRTKFAAGDYLELASGRLEGRIPKRQRRQFLYLRASTIEPEHLNPSEQRCVAQTIVCVGEFVAADA